MGSVEEESEALGLNDVSRMSILSSSSSTEGDSRSHESQNNDILNNYENHYPNQRVTDINSNINNSRGNFGIRDNDNHTNHHEWDNFLTLPPPAFTPLKDIESDIRLVGEHGFDNKLSRFINTRIREEKKSKESKQEQRRRLQLLHQKEAELQLALDKEKQSFEEEKKKCDKLLGIAKAKSTKLRQKVNEVGKTAREWQRTADEKEKQLAIAKEKSKEIKTLLDRMGFTLTMPAVEAESVSDSDQLQARLSFANLDPQDAIGTCYLIFDNLQLRDWSFTVNQAIPPFPGFEEIKKRANDNGDIVYLTTNCREGWNSMYVQDKSNSRTSASSSDLFPE